MKNPKQKIVFEAIAKYLTAENFKNLSARSILPVKDFFFLFFNLIIVRIKDIAIKNNKNSIRLTFFLSLFLIFTVVPAFADPTAEIHNNLSEDDCKNCHLIHYENLSHSGLIRQNNLENNEDSQISSKQDVPLKISNNIDVSSVVGNITLVTSLGQNWYQQGIFGLNTSNATRDKSWGWTFFDETPPSNFIEPSEKTTQRNNIYAMLLDSGNYSNPIKGALVTANITYWIYDGTDYLNSSVSVQLSEDTDHSGLYSGSFYFYGGTTYKQPGSTCSGCHLSIFHGIDTLSGYFPGNYSITIEAEADSKIATARENFEVTPWGCEDCHGSGNQHKTRSVDLDSACYLCHGINQIVHDFKDAGNPHQNNAHRNIECTDCHTNKSIDSSTFNGVTFTDGSNNERMLPQYEYTLSQLNSGTHISLNCGDCHTGLTLPAPPGGYKQSNYTVQGTLNSYSSTLSNIKQFQEYYIINVVPAGPLNISLNWEGTSNIGFYLYPPNFDPDSSDFAHYDGSTFTNKPENYSNVSPLEGKWILAVYGYDLLPSWVGILQSPINYTINSTYPLEKKNLPDIPECSHCHNPAATGGAFSKYEIPDWNPGFAHVDTDNDGMFDIQCRMCHDSMHDISIRECVNCHTSAPAGHPVVDPEFLQFNTSQCLSCHGDPHNVSSWGSGECIPCHQQATGPGGVFKAIDTTIFTVHSNVNTTYGTNNLTDNDCQICHYDVTSMIDPGFTTPTLTCIDCHPDGDYNAPSIENHRPGGIEISTDAYCSDCHNNSINQYAYSENASVCHYGTNTSLPLTVNQTTIPVFGFMTETDASAYNSECNNCHDPSNPDYGNPPQISVPHSITGTCNQCHVDSEAVDLHSSNLEFPPTTGCLSCHTSYADRYGAPNLMGTIMKGYSSTSCEGCHGGGDVINGLLDLSEHNIDRNENGFTGIGGSTDTVYLDGHTSLIVTKGTVVTITSRVNDASGKASRVRGAEYYFDVDPGQGKGIPMAANDGQYDAVNGAWEDVTGTIDTSRMSDGTYAINVRGMDIGKQWSSVQSASLTVQSLGFVNGTVLDNVTITGISGAVVTTNTSVSTTVDGSGSYSLEIEAGSYILNVTSEPEYYPNNSVEVTVVKDSTVIQDIELGKKPAGSISGVVKNASSGSGISGAIVKLDQYPLYNATTDIAGNYIISSVPYGTYSISASASGYGTNISTVAVSGATSKDFQLDKLAMLLKKSKVLYIPWVNESTDYRTNIQLSNPESTNALVNISMYDASGNFLATNSTELSPNMYLSINNIVTSFLGLTSPLEGYLYIDSNVSIVAAGQVIDNNNNDPAPMSGVNMDMLGTDLALPSVVRGWNWYSNVIILNPNGVVANVNLTEYYDNGTVLATKSVVIPANGALIQRDIVTFMGVESGIQTVGAFRAESDVPVFLEGEGKNLISGNNGFADAADLARTSIIQYIPSVNESIDYRTNVQLANFNPVSVNVNISMFDSNGNLLANNSTVLSPNMYVSINNIATSFLGLSSPQEGYLVIESNNTGLIAAGQVIDNNNNDPAPMGMTTKEMGSSNSQMLASVVRGWNWLSNVFIVNPNDVSANVDLTEYYDNGTVLANKSLAISPNGALIERDIVTFMGVESGLQTVGAFRIESDVPIMGTGEGKNSVTRNSGFGYAFSVQ